MVNKTRKRKDPRVKADEPLHEEAKPEKTVFINKYGFLHINEKLAEHLGVPKFGKDIGRKVPVTIKLIENGFIVRRKV